MTIKTELKTIFRFEPKRLHEQIIAELDRDEYRGVKEIFVSKAVFDLVTDELQQMFDTLGGAYIDNCRCTYLNGVKITPEPS